MHIANFVRGVQFAQIKPGALFQFFDTNGNMQIGMKVCGAPHDGVLVLKGHPPSDWATISWMFDNRRPPWGDDLLLDIFSRYVGQQKVY